LECHNSVIAAIHNPLSKLAIAEAITINCQNDVRDGMVMPVQAR
jgi:hypothetical protein